MEERSWIDRTVDAVEAKVEDVKKKAPRGDSMAASADELRPVTYEEAKKIGEETGNPYLKHLDEKRFEQVAQPERQREWVEKAVPRYEKEASYQEKLAQQEAAREARAAGEERINRFSEFLGGETDTAALDLADITDTAATLLALEGDEYADARAAAAIVLANNQDRLKPHIEARLGEDWWAENYLAIRDSLPEDTTGTWGNFKRGLGELAATDQAQYIFDALSTTEQAAAGALGGLRAAVDVNDDVSARDALAHMGSSTVMMPVELAKSVLPGFESAAANGNRHLTTSDGRVLSFDVDGSGHVSLREAWGISETERSDLGDDFARGLDMLGVDGDRWADRTIGAFDTVGLAAIDPLSWSGLGASNKARIGVTSLVRSGDSSASAAGVLLRNGKRFDELPEALQASARAQWASDVAGGAGSRSVSPQRLREIRKAATDEASRAQLLVDAKVKAMEAAVRRGSVPGFHVVGQTVIPMRRVFNSLGFINTSLAEEAAWAIKMTKTFDIEDTTELLDFIHRYEPGKVDIPAERKDDIRRWSALTRAADEDPERFLRGVLADVPNPDDTIDEIVAFGREMYGDKVAGQWMDTYNSVLKPSANGSGIVGPARRSVGENIAIGWTGDDLLQRMESFIDSPAGQRLRKTDGSMPELSPDALARVDANIGLLDEPMQWALRELNLGGLRGLRSREVFAGRVLNALVPDSLVELGERIWRSIRPRADIARSTLGENAERALDQLATEVSSAARSWSDDWATRFRVNAKGESELAEAAARELPDTWQRRVENALSDPDGIDSHVNDLMDAGHVNSASVIRQLSALREAVLEANLASGADLARMMDQNGYMARVQSREAFDLAEQAGPEFREAFETLGISRNNDVKIDGPQNPLNQGGQFNARSETGPVSRDATPSEANVQAQDFLRDAGLPEELVRDFRMFEENPINAAIARSDSAIRAQAYAETLEGMSQIRHTNGRPLVYKAPTKNELASMSLRMEADKAEFGFLDYVEVNMPGGGVYQVERTIFEEIQRTQRIIRQPQTAGAIREGLRTWNDLWALSATVPNPAFHMRNAIGNIYNMVLAGFKDPTFLPRALVVQRQMSAVRRTMADNGLSFSEAAARNKLPAERIELLEQIRKYDLGASEAGDLLTGQSSNLDSMMRSAPVRAMRSFGAGIESNARIALYMDSLEQGMSPVAASQNVRQHLFDYADLTSFETDNLRMLSRFYTFMRKNTELQMRTLVQNPGRIANANRAIEEFEETTMALVGFDKDESGEYTPPPWAQNSAVYSNGERFFTVDVETPLKAAIETMEDMTALYRTPAYVAAGAGGVDMSEVRNPMLDILGVLSGGPVEGIKAPIAYMTDTSLFTGANLNYNDRSFSDKLTHWTNIAFPALRTYINHAEGFGWWEDLGVNQSALDDDGNPIYEDSNIGGFRLLNVLGGFSVTESRPTEDQRQAALDEVQSFLNSAQRDVPNEDRLSIDDLVEMGDLMQRNDVLLHVLYTGRTPDNFTEEDMEWLRARVPNRILTDMGLNTPTADSGTTSDLSPEKAAQDARERIAAINMLREAEGLPPLSQAEEDDVLKYSLGLNITEVEEFGIEAYRPYNKYLDERDKALEAGDVDAVAQANRDYTAEVLRLMGRGSIEDFVEDNPLMTWFDRDIQNMREAGYTEQEIADKVAEDLSRERRAIVFGEESLDTEFTYEEYTEEELERMEKAVRNEASQMEWLWMYQFGRQPSAEEVEFYMAQVFFTSPEQDRVGVDRYTAPRRDNETSDSVYLARQAAEAQIIDQQVGTDFSSRINQ